MVDRGRPIEDAQWVLFWFAGSGVGRSEDLSALDATTGQNAHIQAETFRDITKVDGLIVTKLDGTARGGVLVALADRLALPIHAIGVGEGLEDLRPFAARDFARSLLGLDLS